MSDADITAVIEEKNRVVRENWELRAALAPFAKWYADYGPEEIAPDAVAAYRRAAELLSGPE